MSWQDTANASFEMLGGIFLWLNVLRLYRDKLVRGWDWRVMVFFTVWGFWNLYYYPHLDQWLSFVAGAFIAVTNAVYLALALYYIRKERQS